ncbi:ankyrin repeat domain-containing protein [Streptomyces xanthophaeus]|uniref:ankyrin repeat domain-containing protein n=1 Tax=Streptomyces xanthophaeus TaxID=67385 RepID=UPI002648D957|nr:ankyrin repeat domain-containing protein [Streptomyces xanthophaeus]WKD35801.1 ankyrin repeat domain-containing protein [Streptomyces xanthophaeus]
MTAAAGPEGEWSDEGRSDHYNPLINGLGRAAESGDTALVQRLLAAGAEADAYVIGGRRALDLAVCAGHAEIVRLLLAAGADPRLDAGPYDEATPMCLAAMRGDMDVARALLDAGAPPGGPAGRMRYVPLVLAATRRDREHTELVDLLLDRGADIEEEMRDRTVLDWSARFGYPAVVELLLARGAVLTERTVREGTSGQWITARRGPFSRDPDHKAVRALLVAAWEARQAPERTA